MGSDSIYQYSYTYRLLLVFLSADAKNANKYNKFKAVYT